ncbi:MAG: transcription termination/antitermination protein NusA, partial [Deltaproteobacteria bacterium]|nr:transcription termination/antitermination protein NusA [Kofleriaceae bacterium]
VKSLDAIAELDDERLDKVLATSQLDADEANEMIMRARAHWFGDEEPAGEQPGEDVAASAD